jgi:NADH dehydrogenase
MRVLVLGGAGFIGRHVAAALAARGHGVIIGSRSPERARRRLPAALRQCELREAHLERLTCRGAWHTLLAGCDTAVNAVGILRERGAETYDRVHHRSPAALAAACAFGGRRLIHVSALGLRDGASSGFLRSKLAGERAIALSGARYSIVRPSLLDGEGGFGARWLRWLARWPVHFVPAEARGRLAVMAVTDLGEAIAALCEREAGNEWLAVELGGSVAPTMAEYLRALRGKPALRVPVPRLLARLVSHICDLAHFSPFSFGHLELLRRDNVPCPNALPRLLGREPLAVVPRGGEVVHLPAIPLRRPAL